MPGGRCASFALLLTALSPASDVFACSCGDVTGDDRINLVDFVTFSRCFGLSAPDDMCSADEWACLDLDANGIINLSDFSTFVSLFGSPPLANEPPNCLPEIGMGFVEVGGQRGFQSYQMTTGHGGGVAAADYDDDGDVDLFVATDAGVPDQLYRNDGSGQYTEIAALVGLAATEGSRNALWFDYDGDGDLDLVVGNDNPGAATALRLYRQDAPDLFVEVTQAAGLFLPLAPRFNELEGQHRGNFAAGDLNGDGYLELFAGAWNSTGHLFLNNADGTFTDIGPSSGVTSETYHHATMMHDFNDDGLLDIYMAIDFRPNQLWINQGNGTFVDVADQCGADNAMNDMGMSLGDFDNDGDLDVYVTNIHHFAGQQTRNVLLCNLSSPPAMNFFDLSQFYNVVDDGGWGWGVTFVDIDNDGWLDIAETNGWSDRTDTSRMFHNPGDGGKSFFTEIGAAVNHDDTYWGACLIALDYDRDGDQDLVQACRGGPLRLLENRQAVSGTRGAWLLVRPRMTGPNRFAIGAVVRAEVGPLQQMRLITAGTSYLGQEPAEAFFGLGVGVTQVSRLTVEWPDGSETELLNIPANQIVTINAD